jgi:hypothetical protein
MLDRQLPQAMIDAPNPIFTRDLRRIRWFRDREAIQGFSILSFFVYAVMLGMIILGGGILTTMISRPDRLFWQRLLPDLSLILSILPDVYYVFTAVSSINRMVQSGEWDLVKLTPLHEQDILAAKYSIAQLRAWPVMSLDRLGQLLPLVILATFRPLYNPEYLLFYAAPTVLISLLTPAWRMRALTAAGLAVSASVRSIVFAMLIALGVVLALHIGLFAIADLTTIRSPRALLGPAGFRNFYNVTFLWLGLLANAVALVFTYFGCRAIQLLALRYTLKNAFRRE